MSPWSTSDIGPLSACVEGDLAPWTLPAWKLPPWSLACPKKPLFPNAGEKATGSLQVRLEDG